MLLAKDIVICSWDRFELCSGLTQVESGSDLKISTVRRRTQTVWLNPLADLYPLRYTILMKMLFYFVSEEEMVDEVPKHFLTTITSTKPQLKSTKRALRTEILYIH